MGVVWLMEAFRLFAERSKSSDWSIALHEYLRVNRAVQCDEKSALAGISGSVALQSYKATSLMKPYTSARDAIPTTNPSLHTLTRPPVITSLSAIAIFWESRSLPLMVSVTRPLRVDRVCDSTMRSQCPSVTPFST